MSDVAIEKCLDTTALPAALWQRMEAITDEIRQRAFSLFERRGGMIGWDLDDWLQAEREVVWSPGAELIEKQGDFRARLAMPGFDAKDIQVTATPESLIIEARQTHTHEGSEGAVCFCEFTGKKIFRRLDLPSPINVDHVTASLDKGILQINAPRAGKAKLIRAAA